MRSKVVGTASRPRLSVFRSNRFVYGQLIDDMAGKTLVGVKSKKVGSKSDAAYTVGKELANRAMVKNIKRVTFDRGGYRYQGRVRALADGARAAGLEF